MSRLLRTDARGLIAWDRIIGEENQYAAAGVFPSGDGGFFAYGSTRAPTGRRALDDKAWLALINEQGKEVWEKIFAGDGEEYLSAVLPARDGGYVGCGADTSSIRPGFWLVKTDEFGNVAQPAPTDE